MTACMVFVLLSLALDASMWLAGLSLLERWEGADPREIAWQGAYPV